MPFPIQLRNALRKDVKNNKCVYKTSNMGEKLCEENIMEIGYLIQGEFIKCNKAKWKNSENQQTSYPMITSLH